MHTFISMALRALLASGVLSTATFASAGSALPASQNAEGASVSITNYKFDAPVLRISPGTRVTWTNVDEAPHTVTSTDKRFVSSPALDSNDHYAYTFTKAGTYRYYCTLHPFMAGEVIVQTTHETRSKI